MGQVYLMGADPEFEIRSRATGEIIAAHTYIRVSREVGWGTDISHIGELRPRRLGGGDPYEMMKALRGLIRRLRRRLPVGIDASAGQGIARPVGGHIHFTWREGMPEEWRYPPSDLVLKTLYNSIALPLLTISNGGVREFPYNAIRSQPYGWEYRAPPSWLSTVVVARGALAWAWVIYTRWSELREEAEWRFREGELWRREEFLLRGPVLEVSGEYEKWVREFIDFRKRMAEMGRLLEECPMLESWGREAIQPWHPGYRWLPWPPEYPRRRRTPTPVKVPGVEMTSERLPTLREIRRGGRG